MHGGPREPGPGKKLGRPIKDNLDRKKPYGTKLEPIVVMYLRSRKKGEAAGTIEKAIKRSKDFREWLKMKLEQVKGQ